MFDELYCKTYVKTELSKQELLDRIANIVDGQVNIRTIEAEIMAIDLVENEDYDAEKLNETDGFIYYPFYLEIDPVIKPSLSRQSYISGISHLLEGLWNELEDAVAACEFEDQLPSKET
ncbi:MAG: hypothetical protein MJA27_06560 [Pseudanabaenales cyanobacterium]|nr:hypothetical protein [Pseudanabaenales cyanobacterium]